MRGLDDGRDQGEIRERSGRDFIYLSLCGTVVFKGVSGKIGGDEPFFATINRKYC
jgi:hypothetical protein